VVTSGQRAARRLGERLGERRGAAHELDAIPRHLRAISRDLDATTRDLDAISHHLDRSPRRRGHRPLAAYHPLNLAGPSGGGLGL